MSEAVAWQQQALAANEIARNRWLYAVIGVATATFCTALAAQVAIPLPGTDIPFTLQTFFVLLSAAMLGARLGVTSQLLYVALGTAGLPMFSAGGSGAAFLLGRTGGYLIGFVVAAFLIGLIMSGAGRPSLLRGMTAMIVGNAAILLLGGAYLAFVLHMGVEVALAKGVVPFLPGDAVKLAVAFAIWRGSRDRVNAIFG